MKRFRRTPHYFPHFHSIINFSLSLSLSYDDAREEICVLRAELMLHIPILCLYKL